MAFTIIEVSRLDFVYAVKRVLPAMSTGANKWSWEQVHFYAHEGKLWCEAMDGPRVFRACVCKTEVKSFSGALRAAEVTEALVGASARTVKDMGPVTLVSGGDHLFPETTVARCFEFKGRAEANVSRKRALEALNKADTEDVTVVFALHRGLFVVWIGDEDVSTVPVHVVLARPMEPLDAFVSKRLTCTFRRKLLRSLFHVPAELRGSVYGSRVDDTVFLRLGQDDEPLRAADHDGLFIGLVMPLREGRKTPAKKGKAK